MKEVLITNTRQNNDFTWSNKLHLANSTLCCLRKSYGLQDFFLETLSHFVNFSISERLTHTLTASLNISLVNNISYTFRSSDLIESKINSSLLDNSSLICSFVYSMILSNESFIFKTYYSISKWIDLIS
jgi:hypothetical protein